MAVARWNGRFRVPKANPNISITVFLYFVVTNTVTEVHHKILQLRNLRLICMLIVIYYPKRDFHWSICTLRKFQCKHKKTVNHSLRTRMILNNSVSLTVKMLLFPQKVGLKYLDIIAFIFVCNCNQMLVRIIPNLFLLLRNFPVFNFWFIFRKMPLKA